MLGGWKNQLLKQNFPKWYWEEIRKIAETKHKLVIKIPVIVRVNIIAVEPPVITVAIELENVRIAIGVGNLCVHPSITPFFEYSRNCIEFVIKMT
jgi:hypothetical protein